jgi:hypothetical protein
MAIAKNTSTTLEAARRALAQLEQEADGLVASRDKVLLDGGATSEAIQINKQIDATRRAVEAEQRRVHLLEQRAAQEEVEAAKRRHEEHVLQFEKTLEQADAAGDELQAAIAIVEQTFCKTIELRERALSMWPFGRSSHADAAARAVEGCALAGGAIAALVANEIHRISFVAPLGGKPGEKTKVALPGGIPPRLTPQVDRAGRPVPLVPLAEKLRTASKFAVSMLRDNAFTPPVVEQPPAPQGFAFNETAPVPQQEPSRQQARPPASAPAVPAPSAGDTTQEFVPVQFRERLATLLRLQMRAAASGDDRTYEKCVTDMVALRREIDAARSGEEAA